MTAAANPSAGAAAAQASGLMMALLQPPAGREDDFNDWCDTEHVPARAEVPGFLTARRWRLVPQGESTDAASQQADYLNVYDLADVDVLASPAYLRLREIASDREKEIGAALVVNDRRVYRQLPLPAATRAADLAIGGPHLLAAWWEHGAAAPAERLAALMSVPGVHRVRAFERVDAAAARWAVLIDLEASTESDAVWPADLAATTRRYRLQRRFT